MSATNIAVCDLASVRGGSLRDQARAVLDIGAAARTAGFFAVVNHQVPGLLTEQVLAAARRLFALPTEVKDGLSFAFAPHARGYARLGDADGTVPSGRPRESFALEREPLAGVLETAGGALTAPRNVWPDLAGFRSTTLSYVEALETVGRTLQRAFALDLSMPPDFFATACDPPRTSLHLVRYPARDAARDERGVGADPASDWGIFSLIAPGAGALEFQASDGTWLRVEVPADALVCAVGDCLTRWSNDRYVSRPHRIVNTGLEPCDALALFVDPNPDTLIACLPSCQDEDTPPKYPPISYAEYGPARSGARTLVGAR